MYKIATIDLLMYSWLVRVNQCPANFRQVLQCVCLDLRVLPYQDRWSLYGLISELSSGRDDPTVISPFRLQEL